MRGKGGRREKERDYSVILDIKIGIYVQRPFACEIDMKRRIH